MDAEFISKIMLRPEKLSLCNPKLTKFPPLLKYETSKNAIREHLNCTRSTVEKASLKQ